MIVIRFQRKGKKNQPFFRIVVCDKRNAAKAGRSLEVLGFFNPLTKEKKVNLERAKYWLSVGAQPSDRVHNLLVQEGVIKADKKAVHTKSKKKEGEDKAEEKQFAVAEAVQEQKEAKPAEEKAEAPEEKPKEEAKPTVEAKPAQTEKTAEVKEEKKEEVKEKKEEEKKAEKKEEKKEEPKE